MRTKGFCHNKTTEPVQKLLLCQPSPSKKIIKKSCSSLLALSIFLQQTIPAWGMENTEKKSLNENPSILPSSKTSFQTPHEILDDLLFSSLPDDGLKSILTSETSIKPSSIEDFFADLNSPSFGKKVYQSISAFSFGRAFVVSYLMEPLFSPLPCLEIHTNLEGKKYFKFKVPKLKNSVPSTESTSQEAWKHIYGFKNPLYLLQLPMQQEILFGIRSLLTNLLPELELLKFTNKLNQFFQNQSPSFSILPLGIERTYERWTNLIACLKDHSHSTYQGLFYRLQPLEARYYQKKASEHPNDLKKNYDLMQNNEPNWPSLVKEFFPENPFYEKDFQRLYGGKEGTLPTKGTDVVPYSTLLSLLNTIDLRLYLSQHKERVYELFLWLNQHHAGKDSFPSQPTWKEPKVWKKVLDHHFEKMKKDGFSNQQDLASHKVS